MKNKLIEALNFFWVCLLMGTTCFGGGYAMIPIMEKEFAEKRKYVTIEELTDIIAIGQSLPGLISLNTLILLSYRRAGIMGVIMSMLGLVIPSVVIITLIYFIYEKVIDNKWVNAALMGIKGGVIGILIYAVYKMWKTSVKMWFHYVIVAATIVLALFTPLNPIYIILLIGGSFVLLFVLSELIFKRKWKLEKDSGDTGNKDEEAFTADEHIISGVNDKMPLLPEIKVESDDNSTDKSVNFADNPIDESKSSIDREDN